MCLQMFDCTLLNLVMLGLGLRIEAKIFGLGLATQRHGLWWAWPWDGHCLRSAKHASFPLVLELLECGILPNPSKITDTTDAIIAL